MKAVLISLLTLLMISAQARVRENNNIEGHEEIYNIMGAYPEVLSATLEHFISIKKSGGLSCIKLTQYSYINGFISYNCKLASEHNAEVIYNGLTNSGVMRGWSLFLKEAGPLSCTMLTGGMFSQMYSCSLK
jgi:hypothetical protein